MKAIALKDWIGQVPDGATVEVKSRYGDWGGTFKMRVVYPLLVAEDEVEVTEEP